MKEHQVKTENGITNGEETQMNDVMEERLISESGKKHIKLPGNIKFLEREQEIEIILKEEAAGIGEKKMNMQEDAAAFEGWAVILNRYFHKNVILNLDMQSDPEEMKGKWKGNGHFNRFLYRVMRFWEQYSWFFLSESLEAVLFAEGGFSDWLDANKEKLVNNVPGMMAEDAEANTEKISENWIEKAMTGEESILYDIVKGDSPEKNEIFRQLPAGLFLGTVKAENEVFPGKKAAVDLWTWDEEKFYAFELKYQNQMVGMITEIFFYANYLYDLLVEKNFTLNAKSTGKRGYDNLQENEFDEICGVMTADEMHPLIDEKVLEILNHNQYTEDDFGITYQLCRYQTDNHKKIALD